MTRELCIRRRIRNDKIRSFGSCFLLIKISKEMLSIEGLWFGIQKFAERFFVQLIFKKFLQNTIFRSHLKNIYHLKI